MELRFIVEAAAAEVFVTVSNGPVNHVAGCPIIEMQVERYSIIKTEVFRKNLIPMY